jgi:hypothetical protein
MYMVYRILNARLIVFAVVVSFAISVTGCGGGNSDDQTAAGQVETKAANGVLSKDGVEAKPPALRRVRQGHRDDPSG